MQGFNVVNNRYAGGAFDWLTPFALVTALAVVAGYVLLSAGWLIMKGDEALRDWAYAVACYALIAVRPSSSSSAFGRRGASRDRQALVHAGQYGDAEPGAARHRGDLAALWRSLKRRMRYAPFLLAAAIFLLCYTGLAVSLFPYIIPPSITLWQAAAAPESQLFMLYGAIPILPIIVGYTAYSYYVFWDATEHEGYH